MSVLRVAFAKKAGQLFDYLPPLSMDMRVVAGTAFKRVLVPFRNKPLIGLVVEVVQTSNFPMEKLKTAHAILDEEPLFSQELQQLCAWCSDYYHGVFSETLLQALPTKLRSEESPLPAAPHTMLPLECDRSKVPLLNAEQTHAVETILNHADDFNVTLLQGVTGSGKTEVYLEIIERLLQTESGQALVLIPEIGLTPQTLSRFQDRFGASASAYHSGLTAKKRFALWHAVRDGTLRVVVGTRSALFLPFQKLTCIVIDEEHDSSFKQQERMRYHARDSAIVRAKLNCIPIVLGSATPSLESLMNVEKGRYNHVVLNHRAGNAALPLVQVVDLKVESHQHGISAPLLSAMQQHLTKGHQVLLFLNRRGFAPVVFCTACQKLQECTSCDSRLVYHADKNEMRCHHCDAKRAFGAPCAACGGSALVPLGIGTQRLQEMLQEHFKNVPIYRLDRDNAHKKNGLEETLRLMNEGNPAILLGTQMLAKGHHFKKVTLVGVIEADSGLHSIDFRAIEHMGQLLCQVTGRAGRESEQGVVYVQTYQPSHPLLETLLDHGYAAFAKRLLEERAITELPPYAYLALLSGEAKQAGDAKKILQKIRQFANRQRLEIAVDGPMPALMAKRRGFYREQLLLRSKSRSILQTFLKTLHHHGLSASSSKVRLIIDVDPISLSI